jgi:nicotinamidase-related amidase
MRVLLVVDVQNDFVTGALTNPEAQNCILRIKEKIQQRIDEGWTVMFTQDTHQTDYLETAEGKYLPVEHCVQDTWGWQIVEELKELCESCQRITKRRFGHNDLFGAILRSMPNDWIIGTDFIDEIELIGFCTDICVVSNALILKADVVRENTIISCDASCCAGTTKEAHNAALRVMQSCQVEVRNDSRIA